MDFFPRRSVVNVFCKLFTEETQPFVRVRVCVCVGGGGGGGGTHTLLGIMVGFDHFLQPGRESMSIIII